MEAQGNDNEKVIDFHIIDYTIKECCHAFLEYVLFINLLSNSNITEQNYEVYANIRVRVALLIPYIKELRYMLTNSNVTIINGCYFYKADTNELLYEPTDEDLERHSLLRSMIDDSDDINELLNNLNLK